MTAQLPLFDTAKPSRANRPVLRAVDLEHAKTIRFAGHIYDVIKVNHDRTVTCWDQARTSDNAVTDLIPFEHIEGIGL